MSSTHVYVKDSTMMTQFKPRKALIVGLHSQDGYLLCHFLLDKGYEVWGTLVQPDSKKDSLDCASLENVQILRLDLTEEKSIRATLLTLRGTLSGDEVLEIYCLAAESQVSKAITDPVQSANVNAIGPIRILKEIVDLNMSQRVRCFFASSSEIYGNKTASSPQCEDTPCKPSSPYGMAKLFMMSQVKFFRDYHNLFVCSGILYNHESHVRPVNFVTRKVTLTVAAITRGLVSHLEIGDLNAERDWGHAEDYVRGIWLMLQQNEAEDFILSTGELHTVRELVSHAFSTAGIQLRWTGSGLDEVGIDSSTGAVVVRVNPAYYKPSESKFCELTKLGSRPRIVGDCTRASTQLNWNHKYSFEETIKMMTAHDLQLSDSKILKALNLTAGSKSSDMPAALESNSDDVRCVSRLHEVLTGQSNHVYVIAEIGINHEGCLATALALIDAAKSAGVDAVKFQKRNLSSIYSASVIDDPNSQEWNIEYLIETLKRVELSEDDFVKIREHCMSAQLELIITPFDEISADFVNSQGVVAFKNASCNMLNFRLLDKMISKNLPILISTGMWSDEDIQRACSYLDAKGARYCLLLSNSTYPCPYEDICLSYLGKLKEYSSVIGYSGHERGTFIPIAAVAMGAKIIEKHITFDRNKTGLDHKASMEPEEWCEMVHQIRLLQKSMGEMKLANQAELLARQSFCLSPYALVEIEKGTVLCEKDFIWRAPGKGIYQHEMSDYIAVPTAMAIKSGECITKSHFQQTTQAIKDWVIPKYRKKWGVKCRFHDYLEYSVLSAPVIEFHCSQKDIYDSTSGICSTSSQLVVHAPEIVDMMLVDICSNDERQRSRSLDILQDTINKTITMSADFPGKPKLVVHFGGMQLDSSKNEKALREELLGRAISNFAKLSFDKSRIDILPENLPPKPWYLGGEWNQYGFMTEGDIMSFCDHFGLKMTLDICHAQLYCRSCDQPLVEYARRVKKYVSHVHISDATGVGGEGVQVHDGEINFQAVLQELGDCNYSWVTEIWAGHTNNGQGTYKAMQELSKYADLL